MNAHSAPVGACVPNYGAQFSTLINPLLSYPHFLLSKVTPKKAGNPWKRIRADG